MFIALFGIWIVLSIVAVILIKRPEKAGKVRKK